MELPIDGNKMRAFANFANRPLPVVARSPSVRTLLCIPLAARTALLAFGRRMVVGGCMPSLSYLIFDEFVPQKRPGHFSFSARITRGNENSHLTANSQEA